MKQTEDLLKHRGILFQSLSPGKEHGTPGGLVDLIHHDTKQLGLGAFTPLSRQALHIAAHLDHIEARIISRRPGGVRSLDCNRRAAIGLRRQRRDLRESCDSSGRAASFATWETAS
jgi:hypothetical protein